MEYKDIAAYMASVPESDRPIGNIFISIENERSFYLSASRPEIYLEDVSNLESSVQIKAADNSFLKPSSIMNCQDLWYNGDLIIEGNRKDAYKFFKLIYSLNNEH